MQVNKSMNITA